VLAQAAEEISRERALWADFRDSERCLAQELQAMERQARHVHRAVARMLTYADVC
jgi:hypothetical protein